MQKHKKLVAEAASALVGSLTPNEASLSEMMHETLALTWQVLESEGYRIKTESFEGLVEGLADLLSREDHGLAEDAVDALVSAIETLSEYQTSITEKDWAQMADKFAAPGYHAAVKAANRPEDMPKMDKAQAYAHSKAQSKAFGKHGATDAWSKKAGTAFSRQAKSMVAGKNPSTKSLADRLASFKAKKASKA